MNQFARIWAALSRAQQVYLILVPALLCAASYGYVRWKHDSDFRVLFSSLSPEDASAVTQKMRESGIEYKLDETGAAVLVATGRVADARLALAGAGLPRTGRIGFELFDRNNLGASDFAEQVNYRRALEGELERTVATLSEVDLARIHVTFAKESVFLDARQPSKATVVLRLKRSAQLSPNSVVAIANLVASAVDGLAPESVAIVDSSGRLLNRPRSSGDADAQLAVANLEYRQQVESALLAKINSALGPLLGQDRFRASVSAECDFTSSEENEEIMDPGKSSVLTTQSTEELSGSATSGGVPGAAANLPRPPARTAGSNGGLTRRTENATYQPSRTVKHTISPRGNIRRISTAVLVDQTVRWDGVGTKAKKTVVPPSPELMKGVHDIVAGITGYSEPRGDQLTVETLPFENTVSAEPPAPPLAAPKPVANSLDLKQPIVIGAGAAILLLLCAVVFLLLRKSAPGKAVDTSHAAVAGVSHEAGAGKELDPAQGDSADRQIAENDLQQAKLESEAMARIRLPENTRKSEVLVRHIRDSVHKDPVNATNVLRSWIAETDSRKTS